MSNIDLDAERAAFEAKFSLPGGVTWDGTKYAVDDDYVNSYRVERFGGQWEAWQARAASPQATEAQLVGWFAQRSKFGPWIEVEQHEPGAVQFYRAAHPASGGDHD